MFIKLCSTIEVSPGEMRQFDLKEEEVLVVNLNGQLYCLEGRCSHAGAPLYEGALEGPLNTKGTDSIYSKYGDPERFFDAEFPRLKVSEELDLPPADFVQLLERADSLSEPASHDLHPERHFNIRELIVKAEEEWVLPKFQRYYDWGKKDIVDLLESIF